MTILAVFLLNKLIYQCIPFLYCKCNPLLGRLLKLKGWFVFSGGFTNKGIKSPQEHIWMIALKKMPIRNLLISKKRGGGGEVDPGCLNLPQLTNCLLIFLWAMVATIDTNLHKPRSDNWSLCHSTEEPLCR